MTALYQAYATGLARLAMLMLADQQAGEDKDAFFGCYRRWDSGGPEQGANECSGMRDNALGFVVYSTATRKLTSVPYLDDTTCTAELTARVYWSSPSGDTLIALLNSAPEADPAGPQRNEVGLIKGGTFTPLSFPTADGLPTIGGSAW